MIKWLVTYLSGINPGIGFDNFKLEFIRSLKTKRLQIDKRIQEANLSKDFCHIAGSQDVLAQMGLELKESNKDSESKSEMHKWEDIILEIQDTLYNQDKERKRLENH